MELRHSRYKYIATYKERIDSLLSYQKKLHQIIDFYIQPPNQMLYTDTVIRAISELHKIEISIFSLWKQIPDLPIGKNQINSTATTPEPRPTTYPTIRDPNDPNKWICDPAWIEENIRKMEENSNLKDFDITRKDNNNININIEAGLGVTIRITKTTMKYRHLFHEIILKEQGFIVFLLNYCERKYID